MTRSYSPRKFLRQVPTSLLRLFFEQQRLLLGFDWDRLDNHNIDPLYSEWLNLREEQREHVESQFRDVDEVASEEGIRALIEEAQFDGIDLGTQLADLEGHHHKSLWVFLHHQDVFQNAFRFVHADALPGRYWRKRKGLTRKDPNLSPPALSELRDAFSVYYQQNQGRGHHCTVEHLLRGGRQHYFFVFLDDYADTYIGHETTGRLVRRPQRPAFEVIFVLDPSDGTLELFTQGDKQLRADLMMIFSRVVLGEELPPEAPRAYPYDLSGLKSRAFNFPTDPADGIEAVCVRRLRLSFLGNRRRITLEGDPDLGSRDVYDLLEQLTEFKPVSLAVCNVTQVTLQFRFRPEGSARARSMTFDVSFPDSCNLKSLREEYRLLGEKYLKQWGIERA